MKGSPAWGSLKVARPSQVWRHKDRQREGEREREERVAGLKFKWTGVLLCETDDECGCVVCLTVNSRELLCRAPEEVVIFMDTLLD